MTERSRALNIVYVWDGDYPWDVRTEKVCLALTGAGHRVEIVARNRRRSQLSEILPEGTVRRMRPLSWASRPLDATLGFPAFFNPRWHALIRQTAKNSKADIIIVRDLPLCPTAIRVGRKLDIPVILDMAENYPAMMRDRRASARNAVVDAFVRNPHLVELVERYSVRHAAWTLTVVNESSDRLERLGANPARMSVVSNTPPRSRAESAACRAYGADGAITIVYLGILETARGIGEFIDAIGLLRRVHSQRYRGIVIGSGRDAEQFISRARNAGTLDTNVQFLGRLPHDDALRIVAKADVGTIPHHATESWNTTIPNKLFDYMAAGLAVVSSDAVPCKRVIEETLCGEIFKSGDAGSMAAAILRASAPASLQRMGSAGRQAVLSRYNWEHDTRVLLESIQKAESGAEWI